MTIAEPLRAAPAGRLERPVRRLPRTTVIGAVHPLAVGAAPFNTAMVAAMRRQAPVDVISWRRPYPPLLYRGEVVDDASRTAHVEPAAFALDWADPRTWWRAARRMRRAAPAAVVVPWLHPVSAPPLAWLLRNAPDDAVRVVVCHNVSTHEHVLLGDTLTRRTLRHADLFVVHARHQREELAALGLGATPVVEAFHPRFVAADLARQPSSDEVLGLRARRGDPELLLLTFGAVRPYKGVDVAIAALALVDPRLSVRLVVAGRFWEGRERLERQIADLGVSHRVELRDRYVSNEEAALLFRTADAAVLPYRSASQSGVVGLAFAHERPVLATRVGGLPEAVEDGTDGLLVPPEDPAALARAIERLALLHPRLREGVRRNQAAQSFDRYVELLAGGIGEVREA